MRLHTYIYAYVQAGLALRRRRQAIATANEDPARRGVSFPTVQQQHGSSGSINSNAGVHKQEW